MDADLQNGLWDAFHIHFLGPGLNSKILDDCMPELVSLLHVIWHLYFKQSVDTIPDTWSATCSTLRKYFFQCSWNEDYDFIEFVATNCPSSERASFIRFCNGILERELSSYRFVAGRISDISSEEERESIEAAMQLSGTLQPVAHHLKQALDLLTDRKNPDFRNSIKESISAVEALCRLLTKIPKATLGDALKELDKTVKLHPAFKESLLKLYGYTSDEQGIRHSLLDESKITFDDAKFMLVACSAFTNYIKGIAARGGVEI